MDTYTLDHFSPAAQTVHIAVFHNLRNAPEIRKRLIAAATATGPEGDLAREQVDFGFIEGNMVSPCNDHPSTRDELLTGRLSAISTS